jgi:hypothetical protein
VHISSRYCSPLMNAAIFWDIETCNSYVNRHFFLATCRTLVSCSADFKPRNWWYVIPKRRFTSVSQLPHPCFLLGQFSTPKMEVLRSSETSVHFCVANCRTLVSCLADFQPWRWRWYVPPKRRFTYGLHGAISQKLAILITTAVRISNPTQSSNVYANDDTLPFHYDYQQTRPVERAINVYIKYSTCRWQFVFCGLTQGQFCFNAVARERVKLWS